MIRQARIPAERFLPRAAAMRLFEVFIVTSLLVSSVPAQVRVVNRFPKLTFNLPVGLYAPSDGTNRLFILEQEGVIRVVQNDSTAGVAHTFLNLRRKVISGGEMGLLGLAFHPKYAANGYFYVDYTRDKPLRTVISRFRVSSSNPDSADPASEAILLEQRQPFVNHNGGQLAFGPDGYLYIAFGDGGSGGDPYGNGQSTSTWLGKILRIDVDGSDSSHPYAIPPDNPFHGDRSKMQEIYAYGLRNPWRFSFDGRTIWCGDVGQDIWEEIDTIVAGGNFGWNIMEGKHCFQPPSGCNTSGLILPILDYKHVKRRCSITGGFVYRGKEVPALRGKYVYADFCTGEIWALTPSPLSERLLLNTDTAISTFGVDSAGELYFCDYTYGKIYKFR